MISVCVGGVCPYVGPGNLRAILGELGREQIEQGSSYGEERHEAIGICSGLDFAAGWYAGRMTPERRRAALAAAVALLADVAQLRAEHLDLLATASRLDYEGAEGLIDTLDADDDARAAFTRGAAFALVLDTRVYDETNESAAEYDARDLFRSFAEAMAPQLGEDRTRSELERALATFAAH